MYTAVGGNIQKYASDAKISSIESEALTRIKSKDFQGALIHVAKEYQALFTVNSPALILLGVYIGVLILGGIVCWLLFNTKDPMGYWDDYGMLTSVEWFVKFISGVYFIHIFMISVIWIQYKLRWWHVLVLCAIALVVAIAVLA